MNFLCAEDDFEDRVLIRDALITLGATTVNFVRDGAELLAWLRGDGSDLDHTSLPDAVLLDLNVPDQDGFRALREMKADPVLADIPVVVLTGSQSTFSRMRSYRLGAAHHIVKPMTLGALVDELREMARLARGAARR